MSAEQRDPRVDPRAGDVLLWRVMLVEFEMHVVASPPGMVGYRVYGETRAHQTPLKDWRRHMRAATVINTAQEPAHVG